MEIKIVYKVTCTSGMYKELIGAFKGSTRTIIKYLENNDISKGYGLEIEKYNINDLTK